MPHRALCLVILSLATPGWAAAPPPAHRDFLGDPLPRHALIRIGTNRLRAPDLIWGVALSPDGLIAASAGPGSSVLLWNLPSGRMRAQLDDPAGRPLGYPVFSPDGKTLATISCGNESQHNGFCVWDVATGNLRSAASVPGQVIAGWAFSPDGKLLAASRSGQGLVLHDAATGRRVRSIDAPLVDKGRIAFTPRGTQVAVPLKNGSITLYGVSTGAPIRTIPGEPSRPVLDLAFSPDGRRLATLPQGGGLRLWHLPAGKGGATFPLGTKEPGCRVAFTEGGRVLVVMDSNGVIFRLDSDTGKELSRWGKRRNRFAAYLGIAAEGKGPVLFGEWGSCELRLVDPRAGREVGASAVAGHPGPLGFLAISPDGRRLAAASSSGWTPVIRLWDLTTGTLLRELAGHNGKLTDLVWSADGKRLVSSSDQGDQGGTIRLWEPRSGACLHTVPLKQFYYPRLALTPDGDRLVAAGWKSVNGQSMGLLAAWDTRSLKPLRLVEPVHTLSAPAFLDGATLATLEGEALLFRDVESPSRARSPVAIDALGWPTATSADGSMRALLTKDSKVCVMEGDTGLELERFRTVPQNCVMALSSDGALLALTAEAGRIELFDAISGAHLTDLRHPTTSPDRALAFSPDGARLVSGGSDSTALVWDLRSALRGRATAAKPLDATKQRAHWVALGTRDPAAVRAALIALRADPSGTLRLIDAELRAAKSTATEERVGRLIAELDADSFPRRERASAELTSIGEPARQALEKAAREGGSAEVKRRAEALLNRLGARRLTEGQQRGLRVARLLGRIGGPHARRLLGQLGEGGAHDPVTRVARAVLRRLPVAAVDANR